MKSSFLRWSLRLSGAVAIVAALSLVGLALDDGDNSPTPILISEAGSTRALAVPDGVRMTALNRFHSQAFEPGSRVVLFATNLALMDGEGAFVYAGWCGNPACESAIKEETKATIRVLPDEEFRSAEAPATCLKCGQKANAEAVWAKAY